MQKRSSQVVLIDLVDVRKNLIEMKLDEVSNLC